MARDEGLAVIEAGTTIIDLTGRICGQLSLASGPADAQISPDGNFAVWCPRPYAQPDPRLQEQVLWSDADNPIGALRVSGVATTAAIASGATKIAAVLATQTDFRLVLIDVSTGEETDLTASFPKMELQRVQRMRLSNSGDQLLLGWDYEFRVLDLAARKVVLTTNGAMLPSRPTAIASHSSRMKNFMCALSTTARKNALKPIFIWPPAVVGVRTAASCFAMESGGTFSNTEWSSSTTRTDRLRTSTDFRKKCRPRNTGSSAHSVAAKRPGTTPAQII